MITPRSSARRLREQSMVPRLAVSGQGRLQPSFTPRSASPRGTGGRRVAPLLPLRVNARQAPAPLAGEVATPAVKRRSTGGEARASKEPKPNPAHARTPAEACSVCLCALEPGEHAIFTTSCGHQFHFACVRNCVLNKSTSCPNCRREFATMTPPLSRARAGKGPSLATLVQRNIATVRSGAPILDQASHEDGLVHGLLSVDELGRIRPIPPGGLTRVELAKVEFLTQLHAVMPPSSFWRIGEAGRVFHFRSDLTGLGELQREVLEQTVQALADAAPHPVAATIVNAAAAAGGATTSIVGGSRTQDTAGGDEEGGSARGAVAQPTSVS